MNNKKIFFLILFIFIIMLSKSCYAAKNTKLEIDIGEEKSFTFSDLKFNGNVPTKIVSGKSGNKKILSVTEIETGFLFWKSISEIQIKGISEGETTLTISYNYTTYTTDAYGTQIKNENIGVKVYDITVADKNAKAKQEAHKLEERNDDLETYYKTDINDLLNESGAIAASNQMLYLRSILYNDEINGNHKLWDEFVSNTTAEQRENWYKNMTYNLRDSNPEYKTVYNALDKQKQLDSGNITQEEVTESLEQAGQAQKEVHKENEKKIMELINKEDGNGRTLGTFKDIFDDISYYEPTDETVSSDVIDKASVILTIITNIGMILAVLMIAIMGFKYMLGSLEEKAEYKKDMIPYLVGAALVFGISTIVKVLQQLGESINNI